MPRAMTASGMMRQGARPKKPRAPMIGRPGSLTPDIHEKIVNAVRAGNFQSVAAGFAGVSESTLASWLNRGRNATGRSQSDMPYIRLVQDLDIAESSAEVQAVLHWRAAMPKDWKAAQKWLEVRRRERWAPQPEYGNNNGAFAGVNVNLNLPSGSGVHEQAESTLTAPLQQLLEANPALIGATMDVLDHFLPLEPKPDDDVEVPPYEGEYVEIETDSE